ncbi:type I 3-dehydroquinate dehydratase [Bacillus rubiinfantis]|uniref:type I 3-dehydroquinate dehydratase n=1 Tax=Bacillus rubiinfantis TaxID=1499680 RepID=UPI0005A6AB9B|nr:type I 3-dehydroquinate dehydratase [Bacillus rubiinfantis]
MKRAIAIRGITIGEGPPKICVPLVGRTSMEIVEQARAVKELHPDIVEWRVDFFADINNTNKVLEILRNIRSILEDIPLIFTCRSAKEGGEIELSPSDYMHVNNTVIESNAADIIDIELFQEEKLITTLLNKAHAKDIFVIISNHDFTKTPTKEEIISRLCRAQELGADLPKIAVMPTCSADVLTLMDATNTMFEQYADRPLITISMGAKGMITRLAGEVFGSALTFASAGQESAPGQIPISDLRAVLALLHKN